MNLAQENALRAKLKKTNDVNNKLTRRNRALELVLKESRRTNEQLANTCNERLDRINKLVEVKEELIKAYNERLAELRACQAMSATKVGT